MAKLCGNKKIVIKTICYIVMAVTLVSAILCIAYFEGVFIPGWAVFVNTEIECNREEDGIDRVVLKNKKLSVLRDDEVIFKTDDDIKVQNVKYTDLDNDGKNELVMLNYKVGRFGFRRPFWIERNDLGWHQHIYVYRYDINKTRMKPLWMASDINVDAVTIDTVGENILEITDKNNKKSYWVWSGFGFKFIK